MLTALSHAGLRRGLVESAFVSNEERHNSVYAGCVYGRVWDMCHSLQADGALVTALVMHRHVMFPSCQAYRLHSEGSMALSLEEYNLCEGLWLRSRY